MIKQILFVQIILCIILNKKNYFVFRIYISVLVKQKLLLLYHFYEFANDTKLFNVIRR